MRKLLLALAIVAAPALASAQTVSVRVQSAPVTLSAAQRTSIGNIITAAWPSVALAKTFGFTCERRSGAGVWCKTRWSSGLDQATLFGLLVAGVTTTPGMSATERFDETAWTQFTGANLTSLGSFVTSAFPAAAGKTAVHLECTRDTGSNAVTCGLRYLDVLTAAQAWAAHQAGQSLVPES